MQSIFSTYALCKSHGNGVVRIADVKPSTGDSRFLSVFNANTRIPQVYENRNFFSFNPQRDDVVDEGVWGFWHLATQPNHMDAKKDYISRVEYDRHTQPIVIVHSNVLFSNLPNFLKLPDFQTIARDVFGTCRCSLLLTYKGSPSRDGVLSVREGLYIPRTLMTKTSDSGWTVLPEVCTLSVFALDRRCLPVLSHSAGMPFEEVWPAVEPGRAIGKLLLKPLQEIILQVVKDNYGTWSQFQKCCEGATKNEWRIYSFLLNLLENQNFFRRVSDLSGCSQEEYDAACGSLRKTGADILRAEDITSALAMTLITRDEKLMAQVDTNLTASWTERNKAKLTEASRALEYIKGQKKELEAEIEDLRNQAKLQSAEVARAQEIRKAADDAVAALEAEKIARQQQLEAHKAALENQTEKSLAAFEEHAEALAVAIPIFNLLMKRSLVQPPSSEPSKESIPLPVLPEAERCPGPPPYPQAKVDNEFEVAESYAQLRDYLSDNLQEAGVKTDAGNILSPLILTACRLRMPIILAGPAAEDIAEAASTAIFATSARIIDLTKDSGGIIPDDCALLIRNSVKNDGIERVFSDSRFRLRLVFIEIPFAEELALLSPGIYNYALPICTELFATESASRDFLKVWSDEDVFEEITDAAGRIPSWISTLGLSKLARHRLRRLFNHLPDLTKEEAVARILVVPLAFLSGRPKLVCDWLQSRQDQVPENLRQDLEELILPWQEMNNVP